MLHLFVVSPALARDYPWWKNTIFIYSISSLICTEMHGSGWKNNSVFILFDLGQTLLRDERFLYLIIQSRALTVPKWPRINKSQRRI